MVLKWRRYMKRRGKQWNREKVRNWERYSWESSQPYLRHQRTIDKFSLEKNIYSMDSEEWYSRQEQSEISYMYCQEKKTKKILVVPTSLHMGWTLSLAYLLTATETARSVSEHYINAPVWILPSQPLERQTVQSNVINHVPDTNKKEKFEGDKLLKY